MRTNITFGPCFGRREKPCIARKHGIHCREVTQLIPAIALTQETDVVFQAGSEQSRTRYSQVGISESSFPFNVVSFEPPCASGN